MRRVALGVVLALGPAAPPALAGQQLAGPLVVFNAGSLGYPFRELLRAFAARHPKVEPQQESSGSLEAARKITDLGKVPDLLASADYAVIERLLLPEHARWYVGFATNAMVLIHTERSLGAGEINGRTWWQVLLRPGVHAGRSDPALDPNGYRALMVYQLAEAHYQQPGLARRLEAATPPRFMRPKEADLVALVQAGELDYAWSYRSIAVTSQLPYVALPREVDLSDPSLAEWYRRASVRLPGKSLRGRDSLEIRGEPILYALTIPTRAPHPAIARAFARFVLGAEGRAILQRSGFSLPGKPVVRGDTVGGGELLRP